jgi:hypothetical protein
MISFDRQQPAEVSEGFKPFKFFSVGPMSIVDEIALLKLMYKWYFSRFLRDI